MKTFSEFLRDNNLVKGNSATATTTTSTSSTAITESREKSKGDVAKKEKVVNEHTNVGRGIMNQLPAPNTHFVRGCNLDDVLDKLEGKDVPADALEQLKKNTKATEKQFDEITNSISGWIGLKKKFEITNCATAFQYLSAFCAQLDKLTYAFEKIDIVASHDDDNNNENWNESFRGIKKWFKQYKYAYLDMVDELASHVRNFEGKLGYDYTGDPEIIRDDEEPVEPSDNSVDSNTNNNLE